ncbi:MAG: hypothetical protein CVV47_11965 [Spirochaetae bacterium HGW-Spirochaetae-3]|nr:MAG: hypothetical protein CVV47_11965 [Spirochaetae bacterium HGW-Spirochaetae-3]
MKYAASKMIAVATAASIPTRIGDVFLRSSDGSPVSGGSSKLGISPESPPSASRFSGSKGLVSGSSSVVRSNSSSSWKSKSGISYFSSSASDLSDTDRAWCSPVASSLARALRLPSPSSSRSSLMSGSPDGLGGIFSMTRLPT